MGDPGRIVSERGRSQRQQAGVITKVCEHRASRSAWSVPRKFHRCAPAALHESRIGPVHLFSGQLQDRAVKPDARISNRKLRGMHTNRETPGARSNIVARKRPLAALIQAPFGGESQWMSGNYQSLTECRANP
jgi:hypothetical protein